MSSPFVAEIKIFAGNFAPTGYAFCNGQLMPISQNTALFSLLGTYYGGDGKSTFALPDLQGSAPMGVGDGPGLTARFEGEMGGEDVVVLIQSEIPAHNHGPMPALDAAPVVDTPAPNTFFSGRSRNSYQTTLQQPVNMADGMLTIAGGSLPHNNMQPYLVLNFIIAMQGIFPARG